MRHAHTLDANITEYDNCETSISDDSDDVICESAATHGEMTRFLNLTNKDMTELIGGDALSDKHVYAAQKLLQRKYPQVAGLQDSCLSQTRFNAIAPGDRDVVQIHHTRGNHWVVIIGKNSNGHYIMNDPGTKDGNGVDDPAGNTLETTERHGGYNLVRILPFEVTQA